MTNNTTIIVDITVADLSIRAEKPSQEYQNMPMPTNDAGRLIWFESFRLPPDRLNKRQHGTLKDKAFRKAERLVNSGGGIGMSGEYGSITIDESDFIPL